VRVAVVTGPVLPPIIPAARPVANPVAGLVGAGRKPPPLPALPPDAAPTARVYAVTAIDRSGRLADRSILRVLGWTPGRRLDIRERGGVVTARAAADGACGVDRRGFLYLPLTVRRWCRLAAGDRLVPLGNPVRHDELLLLEITLIVC
jgi:hypothetical protein